LAIVRRRVQPWGLSLLLLVSAGCGQLAATSASPAGSTTAHATASPSGSSLFAFPAATGVTCPDLTALGLQRALLTPTDLNRTDVALCDVHDLSHPRALSALARSSNVSFLSLGVIGYVTGNGSPSSSPDQITSVLHTLDLTSGRVTDAASTAGVVLAAGWSPDQSTVSYFVDAGTEHRFFLKRGTDAASSLATISHQTGRGVSNADELLVSFAASGTYVAFVDTFVARLQIFRTSDGGSAYIAPSGGAGGLRTMGAWTHQADRFYFRNNSGAYSWDPTNGITSFSSGVQWFKPAISPGDQTIAYTGTAADGSPRVLIQALSGGATTSSASWRSTPAFLSDSAVLLEVDQACSADSMCSGWVSTGKRAVLHLDGGTESDVAAAPGWMLGTFWPHA
jgi:hypothetical protein